MVGAVVSKGGYRGRGGGAVEVARQRGYGKGGGGEKLKLEVSRVVCIVSGGGSVDQGTLLGEGRGEAGAERGQNANRGPRGGGHEWTNWVRQQPAVH